MTDMGTAPGVTDANRLRAVRETGLLESGPEESFERLGDLARRLLDAPVALISLVDADLQHFKCCLGLPEPYASAGETPLTHSICQHTLSNIEPLVIPDARAEPLLRGNLAEEELNALAYLGVPLIGRSGYALGSFCVIDNHPREWTEDEIGVMVDLAAAVMAEIELRELTLEHSAAASLIEQSEMRLRSIIDSLFIFVGLLEPDGTVLDANATALEAAGLELGDVVGLPFWETYWWSWDESTQDQLRHAIERGSEGQTSRYDAVVRVSEQLRVTIDFQLVPLFDESGAVSGLVPSGLDISERKRVEDDLARLAQAESRQRQQAEDLLRLAEALTAAVSVSDIAARVATIGGDVVGAVFSNIALRVEGRNDLELHHGESLDSTISGRWPHIPLDQATPLGACLIDRSPRLVSSSAKIKAEYPIGAADAVAAGFEALAAIPTQDGRAAVGFAWRHPVEFTPPLRNALEFVAQLTGQALERAERYEQERLVADRLQRSLLPQELPEIPGVDLAARYESGADGLLVGGDWYDVMPFSADRWVLAVGDLVGHGVTAASAMGQLRSAFSALAANANDIRPLVEQLDAVAREIPGARLATMVAVEYDSTSGRLFIVSAGHVPPIIRRRDGAVERIEDRGPPLGYRRGLTRHVRSSVVGPGDALLLYTDGLVERRSAHIDTGIEHLERVVVAVEGDTAAELCDAVYEQVADGAQDDVALLAMTISA